MVESIGAQVMAENDPSSLTAAAEAKALKKLRWTSPGVALASYAGQAPLSLFKLRRRGRPVIALAGFPLRQDCAGTSRCGRQLMGNASGDRKGVCCAG